jgi:DNA repair protein SbcC/Rad50
MIQSLEIQNRQSHENTRLDFHEGVNIVVGRGTSGKSAILRALRWPLENTSGTSQISRWIMREPKGKSKDLVLDGESSVTITKPQGTLRRFRNPEANGYEINGKTLKAVGTGVPEEAKDFFNLSDINIQGQHDPHFLISLPGSQVSAYLNRVVGIEEIDRYMKAAASCIRTAKLEHKALIDAQEADQKALETLAWIDGIQGQLDALDALQTLKDGKDGKLQSLSVLVATMQDLKAKGEQASRVANLEAKFLEAKRTAQAVQGVSARLVSVSRLVSAWETATTARNKAAKVAKLSDALEACIRIEAEEIGASERLRRLEAWATSYRTVKESLSVAGRVARLSGDWEKALGTYTCISAKKVVILSLDEWARKYRTAKESSVLAGKLAALEPLVLKVRKTAKVLDVRKGELRALEDWGLTIQGIKDKLVLKRSEVSELEAKRPESCPLCGGAYGKEKCHAAV